MNKIPLAILAEIPYLDVGSIADRFLGCLTFFDDGDWHFWMVAGEGDNAQLMKVRAWPAEALYFGRQPERSDDICLPFVDFLGRVACYLDLQKPFAGIRDDVLNLSASLAKLRHLQSAKATIPQGLPRMAGTEVEYIVLVCRSLFDLLQEIIAKLWNRIELLNPLGKRKPLKDSFAGTIMSDSKLLTSEEIANRFGFPLEIAYCYGRAAEVFMALWRFRNNLVHHGSPVQSIFEGDGSFLISSRFRPLPDMDLWRDEEREANELVPLLPAIEMLIFRTFAVCDDFCLTLGQHIRFPPPIVPDMSLFLRGYFTEHLIAALRSGAERSAMRSASC